MAVADNSYISTGADMVSVANKIREKAGVSDGLVFPDGWIEAIEGIEAGGEVRIEQGSITFAEELQSYRFVEDFPDIFIVYVEDDSGPSYSSSKYVWAMIQDTRLFEYYGKMCKTSYIFGYNKGPKKYYVPLKGSCTRIGTFMASDFNGSCGAKNYKWYAIYGVTAT